MMPGIYGHFYTLNDSYAVEPRIGFKWDATDKTAFSLGTGLHSQLQPRQVYFYRKDGVVKNKNLEMSKSWQTVLGYHQKIGGGMHLKTEIYYQHLFNIPVTADIPEESMLNLGDDFYNPWDNVFVNKGTGRNYGIDFTLEKFFDKRYYFLLTGSLYDSKYKGYDKVERSTKFAGNYMLNGLFGYEWKIGTRNLLSMNLKASYAGGKRDVPMKLNYVVGEDYVYEYDYSKAYTKKLADYFRADVNINLKTNYKHCSVEVFAEVNNVTNHKNVWRKFFDVTRSEDKYMYQYGFMPLGGCRVYF
jgi:outer membrane receptor protein involved in Fe transport